jgi:hypothetical protein
MFIISISIIISYMWIIKCKLLSNFKCNILNMTSLLDLRWWPAACQTSNIKMSVFVLHISFVFVTFCRYFTWFLHYNVNKRFNITSEYFERLEFWNSRDIEVWIYQGRIERWRFLNGVEQWAVIKAEKHS